ncbi:MAG: SRPBCC family protein [Akkermansiaceae bacterium]|nr:SRPBCC family protein [Akkermansiaceae bacterium]
MNDQNGFLPAPFTMAQIDAYIADGGVSLTNTTFIHCEQCVVFDFVSRPTQWHRWHPATHEVTNAPDRPLVTGETMCEHIVVVGQHFEAVWKVFECVPHVTWVIGTISNHGASKITYALSAKTAAVNSHERCNTAPKNWFMRLFDSTLIKWALVRQSATRAFEFKRSSSKAGKPDPILRRTRKV